MGRRRKMQLIDREPKHWNLTFSFQLADLRYDPPNSVMCVSIQPRSLDLLCEMKAYIPVALVLLKRSQPYRMTNTLLFSVVRKANQDSFIFNNVRKIGHLLYYFWGKINDDVLTFCVTRFCDSNATTSIIAHNAYPMWHTTISGIELGPSLCLLREPRDQVTRLQGVVTKPRS